MKIEIETKENDTAIRRLQFFAWHSLARVKCLDSSIRVRVRTASPSQAQFFFSFLF